jgi:hypothetical protein
VTNSAEINERKARFSPQPYRVRLPGFISDEELGLGDLVKRVTYAVGLRPCNGCERRAAALNRWMTGRRR